MQSYDSETIPRGVEIHWSNSDPEDPNRVITGADFHGADLRLNYNVDISPQPPLEAQETMHIFLKSLGMTQQNQTDYLGSSRPAIQAATAKAETKLGAKRHHVIRKMFGVGAIEVIRPLILAEPPSEATEGLISILCNYPSIAAADKVERGSILDQVSKTSTYYGLRGLYDFITWAYATRLLTSSPPKFVEPVAASSDSDLFVWRQTADGFTVNVFDEERPCAQLEFEGKYRETAWLRAISAEGGRIALKNFFDTPEGRVHLTQAELGALAITCLGGLQRDIQKLGIENYLLTYHKLKKKLGIPKLPGSYAPVRFIEHSFRQNIMMCEVSPTLMKLTTKELERIKSLAHFDSHEAAAKAHNITPSSLRSLLSTTTTRSVFPNASGTYLMLRAAEAHY